MFSLADKGPESQSGLTKQAIRLHGKIISGREASSFSSNDNFDGLNSWTKVFSELSIEGDDSTKISSEVSSAALEFLMLEVIRLFSRKGSKTKLEEGFDNQVINPDLVISPKLSQRDHSTSLPPASAMASQASQSMSSLRSSSTYSQHMSQSKTGSPDAPLQRNPLFFKLDNLGYRVGLSLVERFTMNHSLFKDTLDVVKFICKEYWMLLFRKQIDNLKTNHRVSRYLGSSASNYFHLLS
ncbi:hypothetical protein DSO57_1012930 [Entomophthora muscae]|uniref:Uncharacterized protein n=1 Tax=Entomophthora muscae TaxID=34485 RepID=A0ACC2U4J0_9FUNG|nr:hypothetical protein DSO57_1012930 [Entomophthora muscae]